MKHRAFFKWSGGKDSALALYEALQSGQWDIPALLTNINQAHARVSMHGVREALLDEQARQMGLRLEKIYLSEQPDMKEYEQVMARKMLELKRRGFTHALFGDIFIEDLRRYREDKLAEAGLTASFPLWQKDTTALMHRFLDLGFKTMVICVSGAALDRSFAGRVIDQDFLKDLPAGVDPCGEHGEFHTFVFDGPLFEAPLPVEVGETVYREYDAPMGSSGEKAGFWFTDIILRQA